MRARLGGDDVDGDVLEHAHDVGEQARAVARLDVHDAVRPRLVLHHVHYRRHGRPAMHITSARRQPAGNTREQYSHGYVAKPI